MESYLGYEPNSREEKETTNRRNGYYLDKTIKNSMGETEIEDKVTKRGAFPNDNFVFKLLCLRVVELQKNGYFALSPTDRSFGISFS